MNSCISDNEQNFAERMLAIVRTLFETDMQVVGYGNFSLACKFAKVNIAAEVGFGPKRSIWEVEPRAQKPKYIAIEDFYQIRRHDMSTTSTELKAVQIGPRSLQSRQ